MNNAAVIRGIPLVPPPATPPAAALTGGSCLVRLLVDGKEASSGTGEENPADSPLGALTFLANDLSRRGKTLEAGHFVIAGHTCQVAFSSRPAPPSARTLSQAPVCGARVVPDAAVEFGAHSVLEAYHEGCGTVRAILTVSSLGSCERKTRVHIRLRERTLHHTLRIIRQREQSKPKELCILKISLTSK